MLFLRPALTSIAIRNLSFRSMSTSGVPSFVGFNLALIQLGGVGHDKSKNLEHARDMIHKAASGQDGKHPKPDLIVLPVNPHASRSLILLPIYIIRVYRNVSTPHMAMFIFQIMLRRLRSPPGSHMTQRIAKVKVSECSQTPQKSVEDGLLEVRLSFFIRTDSASQHPSMHRFYSRKGCH